VAVGSAVDDDLDDLAVGDGANDESSSSKTDIFAQVDEEYGLEDCVWGEGCNLADAGKGYIREAKRDVTEVLMVVESLFVVLRFMRDCPNQSFKEGLCLPVEKSRFLKIF
jgi:hypothetical protein